MRKGREFLLRINRRHNSTTAKPLKMDSSTSSSSLDRYSFNPKLRWNPQVEEYFVKAYGAEHFARISESLMHPSCYSCIRVNTIKSTSDAVIRKLMVVLEDNKLLSRAGIVSIGEQNALAEHDPVTEQGICQTTSGLENSEGFGYEDALVGRLQDTSICKCPYPGLDNVVFIKGSGPHKLNYGDDSSQPMKEVIVSRKCAEAVLRGAQVFVPGVLACSAHVEKGDIVSVSVAVEQPLDGKWGFGITRGIVLQGSKSGKRCDTHRIDAPY